jgi:2-methylcitrate dehydratase PrpD
MAEWATSLKLEDVPERVRDKARLQTLSMLAAVYAGHSTRPARAIREVILETRAPGRSTILPRGELTSPYESVMANASASMAHDFDDYLFLGHTGHSAVLSSLALAQQLGSSGADTLLAQVVANEVGGRLGASVLLGPQNGQLWTHLHALASASAAARLMGLDAGRTAHAMAISLYQPPFALLPGFLGPDSKLLSASYPARDGLLAAHMAARGMTGALDVLESPAGFGAHFSKNFLKDMFSGFSGSWVTDTLSYKIYPGCAYIDSAMDALFDLLETFERENRRPLRPAEVISASVRTTILGATLDHVGSSLAGDPLTPVRINFSLPHSLAVGLLAGRLTPEELEEDELQRNRQEIHALADKIEVVHDWHMTEQMLGRMAEHVPLRPLLADVKARSLFQMGEKAGTMEMGPRHVMRFAAFLLSRAPGIVREALGSIGKKKEPFDLGHARLDLMPMPFSAEVTLHLRGEETLSTSVDIPRGAAGRDWTETTALVHGKFRDQAIGLLGEEKVRRAIDLVERMETLEDLSDLTSSLVMESRYGYSLLQPACG